MTDTSDKYENKSIETYKNSSYEKFSSYDRFKFLMDFLLNNVKENQTLLDIGCAKGEFIYCAKDILPQNVTYSGLEYSKDLLNLAKAEKKLSDVTFHQGDAKNFDLKEKFDHVLMSGVLSIFDDIESPIENLCRHITPGGRGYIFGSFNKDDIDVLVKFRNNKMGSTEWEAGLNLFSLETVKKELKSYSNDVEVHPFELSIDLAKTENPITSYTVNTKEKGRMILNGANIVTDFYLFEFSTPQST